MTLEPHGGPHASSCSSKATEQKNKNYSFLSTNRLTIYFFLVCYIMSFSLYRLLLCCPGFDLPRDGRCKLAEAIIRCSGPNGDINVLTAHGPF